MQVYIGLTEWKPYFGDNGMHFFFSSYTVIVVVPQEVIAMVVAMIAVEISDIFMHIFLTFSF